VCGTLEKDILDIVTSIYYNINDKLYSGMVTLDSTKAFDTVCHARLLLKLDHYGVRGTALNLMQSYLINKKRYVSLNRIQNI